MRVQQQRCGPQGWACLSDWHRAGLPTHLMLLSSQGPCVTGRASSPHPTLSTAAAATCAAQPTSLAKAAPAPATRVRGLRLCLRSSRHACRPCIAGDSTELHPPSAGTLCDSHCVDVQSDGSHCGRCGARCAPGTRCVAGACSCASDELTCGGGQCAPATGVPAQEAVGRPCCIVGDTDSCASSGLRCSGTGGALGYCKRVQLGGRVRAGGLHMRGWQLEHRDVYMMPASCTALALRRCPDAPNDVTSIQGARAAASLPLHAGWLAGKKRLGQMLPQR